MKWIDVNENLPVDDEIEEVGNEYYLVFVEEYGKAFAMRIDGWWYRSYTSKIIRNVTHWLSVEKPKQHTTKD